jgi:hypothetical protein
MKIIHVIATSTLCLLCACTTDAPRMTKVNGTTIVQTDKRLCGVKMHTTTTEVKTKEQKLDDLEIEKETREQNLDLKTEERQSAAAFWAGVVLLAFAPICVIIGYLCQGWKFWGGLSVVSGGLGAAFWSFEHLIPYLKWPAFAIGGAVVLWTMWKLKDFALVDKLKKSLPGEII